MATRDDINLFNEIITTAKTLDPVYTRSWFDDLQLSRFDAGLMEITCPDEAKAQYLTEYCSKTFTTIAQQATGHLVSVKFISNNNNHTTTAQTPNVLQLSPKLHPDYTFDNFVVGPGNRLAHASSIAVSNSPGDTYNPLFLYGSVGLGKTHLLHAICSEAKTNDKETQIRFLSCEQFMNLFIQAIEQGTLPQFQANLRSSDILIIDDIQFLREREQSQEEFFHTFNALYDNRKQIVLSADCAPGDIKSLEDRLISRFKWGLVASVDAPSYETRVAIVKKKARLRGLDITEDIAQYIATKFQANIRELEGALTSLYASAQTHDKPIDLELAKQTFGDDTIPVGRQVSISDIIEATTDFYNIRRADLQSKKRSQSIAVPRQVCMFLARKMTSLSLEEIGGHLGGRDHTTVMHACSKITELSQQDKQIDAQIDHITKTITTK